MGLGFGVRILNSELGTALKRTAGLLKFRVPHVEGARESFIPAKDKNRHGEHMAWPRYFSKCSNLLLWLRVTGGIKQGDCTTPGLRKIHGAVRGIYTVLPSGSLAMQTRQCADGTAARHSQGLQIE